MDLFYLDGNNTASELPVSRIAGSTACQVAPTLSKLLTTSNATPINESPQNNTATSTLQVSINTIK